MALAHLALTFSALAKRVSKNQYLINLFKVPLLHLERIFFLVKLKMEPVEQELEPFKPEYNATTKRRRPKIVSEGYTYVGDKADRDDLVYLKGERKDEQYCKGLVKTER